MEGKVVQIDGHRVVRFERYFRHPAEKVWEAITNSQQLAKWLTVRTEMELKVDGKLTFSWENGDRVNGTFSKIVPPSELEYTWLEPDSGHSVVRWKLESEGEGCRLHLTHTFYDSAVVKNYLAGWHVHLDVLDEVLSDRFDQFPWGKVKEMLVHYTSKLEGE
ncbi:SRPBCC family protein [Paenibacillus sp. GCM10027627]|uniref:SRPBCC family protein n=1 Tax=unclassified Paenibacillus TaxID=185978 RepID=UPI003626DE4A